METVFLQKRRFIDHGRGRWTKTPNDRIPSIGGTYAVFSAGKLLYIGSAANVRGRLQDHGIGGKWGRLVCAFGPMDSITVRVAVDLKFGRWLMREARLVRRLQPPMNRTNWRTRK